MSYSRTGTQLGTCAKCKRQIVWVKMKSGKSMPCDTQMITYGIPKDGKGKERIVTPNGEVVAGNKVLAGSDGAAGIGYISHFATCPAANMFRRK